MRNPYFVFEITSRCNSNCIYCYNVWNENRNYSRQEMPLREIKKLFDKLLTELKPSGVTLAGGEPMMRQDIFEIASYLSKKKYSYRACL